MTSYWVANYSMDYIKFLPFAVLCPLIIWLYNMKAMIDNGNFTYFIVLCLVFGWSVIMYSYFSSFKYQQAWDAQIQIFLISFCMGIIMPIIVWIFKLMPDTRDTGKGMQWIFRLQFPTYCFGSAIMAITSKKLELECNGYDPNDPDFDDLSKSMSPFSWAIAGPDMYVMIVQAIVFAILIYAKETAQHIIWFSNLHVKKRNHNPEHRSLENLDIGVRQQISGVTASQGDKKVWLQNIRKVYSRDTGCCSYGNEVALKDITFGLKGGECLSVLGVNGAGKTTML